MKFFKAKKQKAKEAAQRELKALEDEVWNKKIETPGQAIQARMKELRKIIES